MAIENLDANMEKELLKQKKVKENTVDNCHIKVVDKQVHVTIQEKTYVFPKSEIRGLLERLYTE